MTDRLKGVFVTFDRDIRVDDAEAVIDAIRMVKGVLTVEPSVADYTDHAARERVRLEFWKKISAVFFPENCK